MNRKLDTVARAVGYLETCPMCEAIAAHMAGVDELSARLPPGPAPRARDLVSFTMRRFCAWCGLRDTEEIKAGREHVADIRTVWDALDSGRACAPEVTAAFDRIRASLRASFREFAEEFDAIDREFDARLAEMPPPRFPYVCKIDGCYCAYTKRPGA